MWLREDNISCVLRREVTSDIVSLKADGAVFRTFLFKPRESEAILLQRRYNIGQAISVDRVDAHLGSASVEVGFVEGPWLTRDRSGRY